MQVSAARKSTEGGEGSLKKFTGVASLYVKSFNPSKAELEAMGMKADQEPVYLLKDENGKVTGVRFAFLLEGKNGDDLIRSTVNLFIRRELMESKKEGQESKFNYIDKFGKTSFEFPSAVASGNLSANWLERDGLRKACKGEGEVIDFVRCYLNHGAKDECYFTKDDFDKMFAGNFTDFRKNVIKPGQEFDNRVKVLLCIRQKDGKEYQDVYNRKFERAWAMDFGYLHKSLLRNKQNDFFYGPIGETYAVSDFELREYTGQQNAAASAYAGAGHAAMAENPLAAAAVDIFGGGGAAADDDLPF
ncbi:hypothetical protein [Mongoliitalea daihaiensis]|uniref:hypothetical protein n=1 Tax=Mongoliitalea daihaiensis TaxID=2782006 RepID=UPI001F345C2D|nr:hypothetical protein [Mongoliitalea daihaiensis]UJP64051.1 hypothetical protein IPZ59_14655 [Mongoliitalea daihaiensis]